MKLIESKPIKVFSFKEAIENLDLVVKELEQLIAEARESETGETDFEDSHLSSASNPATQDHETGSSTKE